MSWAIPRDSHRLQWVSLPTAMLYDESRSSNACSKSCRLAALPSESGRRGALAAARLAIADRLPPKAGTRSPAVFRQRLAIAQKHRPSPPRPASGLSRPRGSITDARVGLAEPLLVPEEEGMTIIVSPTS